MCVAIVKPKDATITDEELKNCFEGNPDGAGIAFSKDNELYIIKGIFKEDEFIKRVREVEQVAQGDMLIHCRISTSGLVDKQNCHPHIVNDNTVLIHNGVLRDVDVPKDSKISDTMIYIQEYLKDLPVDFMENESILKLIQSSIGNWNKFCFLNNKGEAVIINEHQGEWHNGVWFSNNSYVTERYTYHYPYASYCDYWEKYYDEEPKSYSYGKKTNEETEYVFSKNRIKKIKKKIRHISDRNMYAIGSFPLWDAELNDFVQYDEETYNEHSQFLLDDISPELQEEWDYEYETRFGKLYTAS